MYSIDAVSSYRGVSPISHIEALAMAMAKIPPSFGLCFPAPGRGLRKQLNRQVVTYGTPASWPPTAAHAGDQRYLVEKSEVTPAPPTRAARFGSTRPQTDRRAAVARAAGTVGKTDSGATEGVPAITMLDRIEAGGCPIRGRQVSARQPGRTGRGIGAKEFGKDFCCAPVRSVRAGADRRRWQPRR
jgi:hypothetical protein